MKLRYVFSEFPYAMGLSHEYLRTRCSFCASNADPKAGGLECDLCRVNVYCSETCRRTDSALHQFECEGYRQGRNTGAKDSTDLAVRIMGRFVGRYQLDEGVASLSFDFPSHIATDRCVDDLMTHKREMRGSKVHRDSFKQMKKNFYEFFQEPPLSSVDASTLRTFFYRLCINGFSLSVRVPPQPGFGEELGETVYLNVSRFNHSCRPTCAYKFEGSRIVVEYLDENAGLEFSKEPIDLTKEQFENITLQYGYGSYCNFGSSCSSTDQRLRSLKRRYFFRCACVLCSDTRLDEIQSNAAPVECSRCSSPYVWRQSKFLRSMKLRKSCRCPEEGPRTEETESETLLFGKGASSEVKRLDRRWKKLMRKACGSSSAGVIDNLEPLLPVMEKYWHPHLNLRAGQANEKLFNAISQLTVDEGWTVFRGDQPLLDAFLKAGEAMLSSYASYFESYMLHVAEYALNVALLYKMRSGSPADCERSEHWLTFARGVWTERGELVYCNTIEERAAAGPPMVHRENEAPN